MNAGDVINGLVTQSDMIKMGFNTALASNETSIFTKSFVVVGSMTLGCILGFSLAAFSNKFFEDKEIAASSDPRLENRREIKQYQEKYCEELSQLENKELSDDDLVELSKIQISESTPFGEVIMTYCPTSEAFLYFTDARNVPYKILDTVARCFAVTLNCKAICVNYKEELATIRNKLKEESKTKEAEKEALAGEDSDKKDTNDSTDNNIKPSVFAKFKSYRTNNSTGHNNPMIIKMSNRFTCKGKLSDAEDYLKKVCAVHSNVDTDTDRSKNISFADYKKIL